MLVDIICPLYNAKDYISTLHEALLKQKNVAINKIHYILTESTDNTENILKSMALDYKKIKKEDFSHSKVREDAARNSSADIICFITQDIIIETDDWLFNLVEPIIKGEVSQTYSRQISKFNNIEKYTREYNYPSVSSIKTKADIDTLGLKTFFSSDASSAILKETFLSLNAYDGRDLPISEDMYFTYKLIMNDYKVMYCANSIVYHSHNFKLKDLYNRYKLTGKFFKENNYLDNFKTTSSGAGLAKYILKRSIQDRNIKVLVRYPFDMATRLIGMKVGKM